MPTMQKIFAAILPGWTGPAELPQAFPLYIRIVLKCSVLLVHIFAILYYGRTFSMLSQEKREFLIKKLYNNSNPAIRNLVQWWKLLALTLQC